MAYTRKFCRITVNAFFLLVKPPYKKPTPPGVIIITNDAAVYMKAVSPGSMQGAALPPVIVPLPGGFSGCEQWNSDVPSGLASLLRGPNWANAVPAATSPDSPTRRPANAKINGHFCFLINGSNGDAAIAACMLSEAKARL